MFTITLLIVPFIGLVMFATDWMFSLVSDVVLIPISSNCFCKLAFRAFKVFSSASAVCKFFNAPALPCCNSFCRANSNWANSVFEETLKNSSCIVIKVLFEMVAITCPLLTVFPVCTKMDLITPPSEAVAFALFWFGTFKIPLALSEAVSCFFSMLPNSIFMDFICSAVSVAVLEFSCSSWWSVSSPWVSVLLLLQAANTIDIARAAMKIMFFIFLKFICWLRN